jgi:hypothetical protein
MVTKHNTKDKTFVRLLKIRKENERSFEEVMNDIEN